MSNQMVVDFARKRIKELQRELKVWRNVEREYKVNLEDARTPKKPQKCTKNVLASPL